MGKRFDVATMLTILLLVPTVVLASPLYHIFSEAVRHSGQRDALIAAFHSDNQHQESYGNHTLLEVGVEDAVLARILSRGCNLGSLERMYQSMLMTDRPRDLEFECHALKMILAAREGHLLSTAAMVDMRAGLIFLFLYQDMLVQLLDYTYEVCRVNAYHRPQILARRVIVHCHNKVNEHHQQVELRLVTRAIERGKFVAAAFQIVALLAITAVCAQLLIHYALR